MLNSPIDEIKNRLDIVEVIGSYIKLEKAGANYRAPCPFHSEKKPSFFVSPARQIWHCFGCGLGGDIFKFVMQIDGVEFGDALRILAEKAGVELKRSDPQLNTEKRRLFEICELSCRFFEKQLENSSSGKKAKDYLLKRGLTEESIRKWRLGYAPDRWDSLSNFLISRGYEREEIEKAGLCVKSEKNKSYYDRFRGRIMFPIFNLSSQVIGFGGRISEDREKISKSDEAKYVNTPNTLLYDKSQVLYGLNKAGIEIRKKDFCILVEGYMDAIMVYQAGFENVVAASGTGLSEYQLKILKRYSTNLFTAFDMDIAGDSATKRSINLAQSMGFNIKIIVMPNDMDPADVVLKDSNLWQDLVKNAKTIHDFYFEKILSRFDKTTLEGKKDIYRSLLPIIKNIPDKIEQTLWIKDLADILNVKEEDIAEELKKIPSLTNDRSYNTEDGSFDIMIKEPNFFSSKTKKEILEEYLAIIFFKFPQYVNLLKDGDFQIFSPRFIQVVDYLKNNNISNQENNFSSEYNDLIQHLSFKSEIIEFDVGTDIDNEFNRCLKEIKILNVKDKLNEIGLELKKAEKENDFIRIQRLLEEFNSYSKYLCDLEVS